VTTAPQGPAAPAPAPAPDRAARDPLPGALAVLTVLSGIVDATSYLGLGHVFTANMTGNIVVLGFAAAGATGFSITASLTSILAFLAGAAAAGRFNRRLSVRRTRVLIAVSAEAVGLGAAAAVAAGVGVTSDGGRYTVIALMAVAMGVRNATVRSLAVADMTTTVLTLTLTGLAADSTLGGGDNPRAVRRGGAVLLMLLGAYVGAVLVLHTSLTWPLLASCLCGAATVAWYALHPGSRIQPQPAEGKRP
jgi:uncharacterized membrane protein YoaK (UPF0700 family)